MAEVLSWMSALLDSNQGPPWYKQGALTNWAKGGLVEKNYILFSDLVQRTPKQRMGQRPIRCFA